MKRLTPEQIDQIIERRERGHSYRSIAQHFGVSSGAILYQCLKAGAVSPHQRQRPIPTEPKTVTLRNGRTNRLFTQAEDEQLLALRTAGKSISAIARETNRAITSVRIRLLFLAVREDIPA